MAVHSILPPPLTEAVDAVLRAAGVPHVAHGDADPVDAAVAAASDPQAHAVIGPFRSADVSEALAATAPARLPLFAPVATWAGVTHDDEPGCDDAARALAPLPIVAFDGIQGESFPDQEDEHGDPVDPLVRFERYDA